MSRPDWKEIGERMLYAAPFDSGMDMTSLGNEIIETLSLLSLVGDHFPVRGTNTAYGPSCAEGEMDLVIKLDDGIVLIGIVTLVGMFRTLVVDVSSVEW